ncbi:MAG: PfkB family carbohydrate kinase [Anaerolineales bacterium]|jgi:fructokinase|nr:PfkB family carbohydrate kinase [Anaerolineales bacterium]
MDIVCLGEILIDMFPAEIGRNMVDVSAFLPKPGGAPANVAVAASRLGAKSAFIGKVGEDIFGHYLEQILIDEDVATQGMRYDQQARTTLVFMAMPDAHSAEYMFYRNPGADMLLAPEDLDRQLLEETQAFHFGSISLIEEPSRSATLEAIKIAADAGALISFDVNYRPTLWKSPEEAIERVMVTIPLVNVLKVNEIELSLLAGKDDLDAAAKTLIDMGPDLCVVTIGAEGSYFRTITEFDFIPGFSVDTVDSVGCGDAFIAGTLCQLVRDGEWRAKLNAADLREVLRYGNAVGALTALTVGVIPALPRAYQVDDFLNQLME